MPGATDTVGDDTVWENLTLGRAVTISGAAIDPNMRNFQSAPFTALLTLLNLRLGWWIENPDPETAVAHRINALPGMAGHDILPHYRWTATNPRTGRRLLSELFGHTDALGAHVHLSDGGHFENTGAYELIRRRCRFVVVIDAAEDPLGASENLANLIRLVRIDFGIRIEVDTASLSKDKDGLSLSHAAVGVIRYDDVDPQAVNGTFVFIRSSMTGDESPDLKNYAANNPLFPHQSTIDQFFDEDQFESYRALGFHIGQNVFSQAAAEVLRLRPSNNADGEQAEYTRRFNRRLFAEIRRTNIPVTDDHYAHYTAALSNWANWADVMRKDPRLESLNRAFYPELVAATSTDRNEVESVLRTMPAEAPWAVREWAREILGPTLDRWLYQDGTVRMAELRAMAQLVDVMEAAWMRLKLNATHPEPLQRGWMNCFRRWTATKVFQRYWAILRPEYSSGFVRFCERVLSVPPVPVQAIRWDMVPLEVQTVVRGEFNRELFGDWASVFSRPEAAAAGWSRDYLQIVVNAANWFNPKGRPLLWVLTYGVPGGTGGIDVGWDGGMAEDPPSFPIGVAAVRELCVDIHPWAAQDLRIHWPAMQFELLFWFRPSYRTSEAGHQILPDLLTTIAAELPPNGGERYLITRLPKAGGTVAESMQRAFWSLFFNDHDFYSCILPHSVAATEVRLRRRVL